jgi:Na+/proline symporter
LVHDFYRRFIKKSATESHYINVGRLCTVGLYLFAATLSFYMTSAQQAFQILLSIGAGTGLIYVARWFWWRVSAWSEVVAMVMSLVTAVATKPVLIWLSERNILSVGTDFATVTIIQVAITTFAWIVASFVLPVTDKATLISFVRKVKPAGPGWAAIRAEAGVSDAEVSESNHTVLAFVGWASGVATIWSSLFAIGNFLYAAGDPSRLTMAWVLTAIFVVSGLVLLNVIQRLWAKPVEA